MQDLEICRMPAVAMAKAIRNKQLSPVEAVGAILRRIEKVNPVINAYCTVVAESALAQAKEAGNAVMAGKKLGPLHGVPVSIKDLIFTKGIRTTGGSKMFENFVPEQDNIAVERLKAAGAIIIGKTNTPEFGWLGITQNPLFGVTRNPWTPGYVTGGSSGGAAAAVVSGLGPIGIGTDVGGSIRIPSSFCNTFGFKPSFGRAPMNLAFPAESESFAHNGPITRTVADAALTMEVIAGRDDRDPLCLPDARPRYLSSLNAGIKGLRVAWSKDLGFAIVDPQVLKATEAAVRTFSTLGCIVEAASPAPPSPDKWFTTIVATGLDTFLRENTKEGETPPVDPLMLTYLERSKAKSAYEYVKATHERWAYCKAMQPFFEKYDLLLTPTLAVPPFEIGGYGPRVIAGVKVSTFGWWPFTCEWDITGQPAASVPCGWTDNGLPVGLQIVGRRFEDATVLRAAAAFEQAAPWADKHPLLD
ncbi:MAG: amidase [Chloroflexi bacterium]|nr:amidase [Chloroflexota bacterium]